MITKTSVNNYKKILLKKYPNIWDRCQKYYYSIDITRNMLDKEIFNNIYDKNAEFDNYFNGKTMSNLISLFLSEIDINCIDEYKKYMNENNICSLSQVSLLDTAKILNNFINDKLNNIEDSSILQIFIKLSFIMFLAKDIKYNNDAKKIYNLELNKVLVSIPEQYKKLMITINVLNNDKIIKHLSERVKNDLLSEEIIENKIRPMIDSYYLNFIKALTIINSNDELDMLREVFVLMKYGKYNDINRCLNIDYFPGDESLSILSFYEKLSYQKEKVNKKVL